MGNENLTDKKTLEEYPSATRIIDDFRNKIREKIGMSIDIELGKKFNRIYDNFNEQTPLDNKPIIESLKGENGNAYENFLLFCDFLICKIINSKRKKEISKIPFIISNLNKYRGDKGAGRFQYGIINDKRAEVINKHRRKTGKNGNFRGGQSKINPKMLS